MKNSHFVKYSLFEEHCEGLIYIKKLYGFINNVSHWRLNDAEIRNTSLAIRYSWRALRSAKQRYRPRAPRAIINDPIMALNWNHFVTFIRNSVSLSVGSRVTNAITRTRDVRGKKSTAKLLTGPSTRETRLTNWIVENSSEGDPLICRSYTVSYTNEIII